MNLNHAQYPGIDPQEVQTRGELSRYLDQSLSGEYVTTLNDDEFTQTSTFVKSYLVEAHSTDRAAFTTRLNQVFIQILPRLDPSLYLLYDKYNNPYFADIASPRFMALHSIEKTSDTDYTLDKLTAGDVPKFDRTWMPTQFLRGIRRGKMMGFKFGFERFVQGLRDPDSDLHLASGLPDGGRRARFRMAVSEDVTAERDYRAIQNSELFSGRKALEHIQFTAIDQKGEYISNRVYTDGKIVGKGTSIGSHLATVEAVLTSYTRLLEKIEDHTLGWVNKGNSVVHTGEPFIITFPGDLEITNLMELTRSIVRPVKPFRLLGIPHELSEERVDVEAIDLHTGDPFALEITKEWLRVYLPAGACGNVVARLYSNLQRSMHSDIQLATGDGEILFVEDGE